MAKDTLKSERLDLVLVNRVMVDLFFEGRDKLAKHLKVQVPETFPVFPESMTYWNMPDVPSFDVLGRWGQRLLIHRKDKTVVGDMGFKSIPDAQGHIEFGYAIIPEYRKQGLASEGARTLVEFAFSHAEVKVLQAHTLKEGHESIGVLKKLGFNLVKELIDPQEGSVLQWQLASNKI